VDRSQSSLVAQQAKSSDARALQKFKNLTGHGVLCNTSLNFKGAGFINRMSDLVQYSESADWMDSSSAIDSSSCNAATWSLS
jgi:predicted NodU family carbamoyl transferase